MPYAYSSGDNCYARGDYYRGDYYRGDPGFLGDLWKGVKKVSGALVRGAVSTVTSGPIAGIKSAIGAFVAPSAQPASALVGSGTSLMIPPFLPSRPGIVQGPNGAAIGRDVYPYGPQGTMTRNGFLPGCQLKGTRPNKSGYYKQIVPGNPANVLYVPKGSVCVKSRRLNVANPRALRRAIRRAQGFSKLARRVMTFVSAKAPKGRAKFKRR